jgi:hypothetical protein
MNPFQKQVLRTVNLSRCFSLFPWLRTNQKDAGQEPSRTRIEPAGM